MFFAIKEKPLKALEVSIIDLPPGLYHHKTVDRELSIVKFHNGNIAVFDFYAGTDRFYFNPDKIKDTFVTHSADKKPLKEDNEIRSSFANKLEPNRIYQLVDEPYKKPYLKYNESPVFMAFVNNSLYEIKNFSDARTRDCEVLVIRNLKTDPIGCHLGFVLPVASELEVSS